ncbi:MAG: IS1380 family transposase [Nitrospirota bacterium]
MTECITKQLTFSFVKKQKITVDFEGGEITSDSGLLLVRQADKALQLIRGMANSITDRRDNRYTDHDLETLLRQRIYQIVAGYEDCNDANLVRKDPALKTACGRKPSDEDLGSQPTLSRFENSVTRNDLYRIGDYFVDLYICRNRKRKPKRIILDLDGTDDPTYGDQQLTFFHGYYDQYMYHPLVIYDADTGELITAVLRPGNKHASYGAVSILKRIIPKLKEAFPKAEIVIRGDAGFAIPDLYEYCESEKLKYVIGLIRNDVLERMIEALLNKAHEQYTETGQKQRMFQEGLYQAQSWPKDRRVIMKAEWLTQGPNSRFVVTNLSYEPKELYEFYTERGGTCEVRIDEFKNGLKADRLSCHRFGANQFRLFLHMAAYWLVLRLREALQKTEFASMQIQQLRLRLLKIGGQVIQTARRVWFRLASGYPWKNIFALAHNRLAADTT